MTPQDLIQSHLQQLDAAVHAHLCRVQARMDALEFLLLESFPEPQRTQVKTQLLKLEAENLERRIVDLDKQSPHLSIHAAELLQRWTDREKRPGSSAEP